MMVRKRRETEEGERIESERVRAEKCREEKSREEKRLEEKRRWKEKERTNGQKKLMKNGKDQKATTLAKIQLN